jgi:hypothetical protein
MELLGSIGSLSRHDDRMIGECGECTTAPRGQGEHGDSLVPRRLSRAEQIWRVAARRVNHEQIARFRERFDLPREHAVESKVVTSGGEQGRVGRQRDRGVRTAIANVANDVLGREVLRVSRAAPVAAEKERTAAAHRVTYDLARAVEVGSQLLGDA